MTSSVVVIHSSSPRLDYELLAGFLPQGFQSNKNGDNNGNNRSFSFVTSSVNNDGVINNRSDTILVLPATTITGNNAIGNELLETVSLATMNTNISQPVVFTSFAVLVLNNTDELRLMTELISERLPIVETKVHKSSSSSSFYLAKFVLPGGCLVTLTTSYPWTNKETRSKAVEFMTTPITLTSSLSKPIVSNNNSKSRYDSMRRSMSMPGLIPPIVTTTKNRDTSIDSKRSNNSHIRRNNSIIPTIQPKVLSFDGTYQSFPLNSQDSFPVETELFSGRLLFIIRPSGDPAKIDPYWNEKIFSKKKRRVIMQLQGKLKYKPTGTLFAGMEISEPMKLGLIANGLCNIILKMTKSFNPAIHYSFGSTDEKACICFPASTFFENLVVTPPGKKPPEMGTEFEELPDVAAARKAYETKIDWNTDDTYSMSFHTQYIDFPTWSVVSLPVGKDLSLQTFWGNSFASVVLYEVDTDLGDKEPHLAESKRYLLSVQLKHLGKDGAIPQSSNIRILEQQDSLIEDGYESELSDEQRYLCEDESISTTGDLALMTVFDEEYVEGDEEDMTEFFDTVESLPVDFGSVPLAKISHNALLSVIDTFCPCWIEMFTKHGKYVTLYAFCGGTKRPLFRTSELTQICFKDRENLEVDDIFAHRISPAERTRRILGLIYAEANIHKRNQAQLQLFHKTSCRFDTKFLNRKEPTIKKVIGIKSGFVARALSDRHWKEETMILLDGIILFHNLEGSKVYFQISLTSVIDISVPKESTELVPLPSYHYLQIETFARVTYLMFCSEKERDSWLSTLSISLENRGSIRSLNKDLIQSDDPVHEFLCKSTMWSCQKRKILNCRRYSFRTPRSKTSEDTLKLAERALAKVLSLKSKGRANDSDLREFFDYAASLKEADAHSLNGEEKICFFLNVYHIMIMHAYIILGPPVSGTEWISYFNTIAYQCSDDLFSLAELEHNIIRVKMTYPSNFISRLVLPKSQYTFALIRPDFRLNFALNAGSLSMPTSAVPLYKTDVLNEQLNTITRQFVEYTVLVKQKGSKDDVQITLPRICQWFAEDFGPNASASDVMLAIEPFLSDEKREALRLIWNPKKNSYDIGIFCLKYLPFNYKCRFLTAPKE